MDDRPNYYVARVPTGTLALIDGRKDAWYGVGAHHVRTASSVPSRFLHAVAYAELRSAAMTLREIGCLDLFDQRSKTAKTRERVNFSTIYGKKGDQARDKPPNNDHGI